MDMNSIFSYNIKIIELQAKIEQCDEQIKILKETKKSLQKALNAATCNLPDYNSYCDNYYIKCEEKPYIIK